MQKHLPWLVLWLMLISPAVLSHHAAGLLYDTSTEISIQAQVMRFTLGNPHIRIYFTRIEDTQDKNQQWMAEGGSRTVLVRRGWSADMLAPGDNIILHGHASRDQRPIFHVMRIELPDGREIGAEDSSSSTILDDIRKRR